MYVLVLETYSNFIIKFRDLIRIQTGFSCISSNPDRIVQDCASGLNWDIDKGPDWGSIKFSVVGWG